jgi:hypothetical protein
MSDKDLGQCEYCHEREAEVVCPTKFCKAVLCMSCYEGEHQLGGGSKLLHRGKS